MDASKSKEQLAENGNFKYLHSIVFVHQTKQKKIHFKTMSFIFLKRAKDLVRHTQM